MKLLSNFGLKGMTEEVLNLTLSKRAKLSNWESKDLKNDQKLYAATDAWIGREIFIALDQYKK
jgi:ribonuclease D